MDRTVHFAKVFGIAWLILTGLWAVVFFRVGSGFDFDVGWSAHSRPPLWVVHLLLFAWPVIPALLAAALWELTRLAMFRRH
jgi:hypothetical protein